MTAEQEKLLLDLINDPPPGSDLAKAKEFGVDLTLFHSTLRCTPTERAQALSQAAELFEVSPLGDLDLLAEVSGLGTFREVLAASEKREIGSVPCQVLSLEGLIKAKTAAGRPQDLYVLPELRALVEANKKINLQ